MVLYCLFIITQHIYKLSTKGIGLSFEVDVI